MAAKNNTANGVPLKNVKLSDKKRRKIIWLKFVNIVEQ